MALNKQASFFLHPSTVKGLKEPYTETNITKKNTNKEYLLTSLGLSAKKKTLLVAIVVTKCWKDLSQEEKEMLVSSKDALVSVSAVSPIFVFADDTEESRELAGSYQYYLSSEDGIVNVELLSGADAFLFVEKKVKNAAMHMQRILGFGGIVVAYKQKELPPFVEQYNPFTERGSAFLYDQYNPWSAFSEVVEVYGVFKFSYDWNTVRRRAMSSIHV